MPRTDTLPQTNNGAALRPAPEPEMSRPLATHLPPEQRAQLTAQLHAQALARAEAQVVEAEVNLKVAKHNLKQAQRELAALEKLFAEGAAE